MAEPATPDSRTAGPTPLARELAAAIRAGGPLTLGRFMAEALGHPRHGYYRTRDPLGAAGDFTTAPEISQMFGELLGLWAAAVWQAAGSPSPVRLVELGPGRGTLMADALRAAAVLPAFRAAVDVHLVETSPVLRQAQAAALAHSDVRAAWHDRVEDVPAGPALILANEFFDALPVRQWVAGPDGWRERMVGLDADGRLAFALSAMPTPLAGLPADPPVGAVLERGPAREAVAATLGQRVASQGGAVLVIDYGHARTGWGDTFQAVRSHRFVDPLDAPGDADLTAHVDFQALGDAARRAGAVVLGPVEQGAFLQRLGLAQRAARLKAGAVAGQAGAVDAAVHRLTHADAMGALFKVQAFAAPGLPVLPGFEP